MHRVRWTLQKVEARLRLLEAAIYRQRQPLRPFRFNEGSQAFVGPDINDSGWPILMPGTYWGQLRQEFTLRTAFTVPSGWRAPVALYLPLGTSKSLEALAFLYGPEALAFLDGEAYQGVDPNHQEILLPERFLDDRPHTLALHGWTGIKDERYEMGQACVVQIDQTARDFIACARIALATVRQLSVTSPAYGHLLNALDAAFLHLDLREPWDAPFYQSVQEAYRVLQEGVSRAGPPMDARVAATGHAHIDVAWLWPLSQTRKKTARTFSTVLRLMEQFPEFHFTQSQPQLYQFVSEDHPEIFEQIKERVAEGRWEIIGGMWIEADCNITGPESLVRQFVLGRRFFLEQFGQRESPILWLPDVFGYAWQLPQLVQQAGLSYFVTAKLSWNQYNRMPYDYFWWQGLDGSRVLTYFITTSAPGWWGATYSAQLTPEEVLTTWNGFQQKESHDELLIAFGYGDGGGGPTQSMLESGREMAHHPALPKVHHSTAKAFLENLERQAGPQAPTWNGELYLELHRGTYTSQARNKRANRKSEVLLHDAEFLASWAALCSDYPYPHADLRWAWELLCLNQFHDIIPGSSISQVYEDSARDYEEIRRIGAQVRDSALDALDPLLPNDARFAIYNSTSFIRSGVVEIAGDWPEDRAIVSLCDGVPLPMQRTARGVLVEVSSVPPYGWLALGEEARKSPLFENALYAGPVADAPQSDATTPECIIVLENTVLRVEFDSRGDVARVLDKRVGREVLAHGQKGNQWQAFEDRPLDWEAWDIDIFYDEKQWPVGPADSMEVVEHGSLRACLEIKRRIFSSDIVQRIYLYKDSARLDFDTWINWQERRTLLKVAFPVKILSPTATYEIQWGNVERSTHRNTSWDWARFESCAHKWVDLSEGNYGVSLLNDCKYGHDISGNVIRLTLLKGAMFPDPAADLGEHAFTYSLFPHMGDWRNGTVPEAYALNSPLIVRRIQSAGATQVVRGSLIRLSLPQVIVETIKQAEDGNGLIVRLYEHQRTRGYLELEMAFPIAAAFICNLLEEDQNAVSVTNSRVILEFQPYQIITLRLIPA